MKVVFYLNKNDGYIQGKELRERHTIISSRDFGAIKEMEHQK